MVSIMIVALVSVAISLVGFALVVANVLNLQTTLMDLNGKILQLQAAMSSAQSNATGQTAVQGQSIMRLEDSARNLSSETASLEARIASLEQTASSLEGKVSSLEHGPQSNCPAPGGCPQAQAPAPTFTPVALRDNTGSLWTSWFIKESLYYPTLYSTSCDARGVDCYVHFSNISAPGGQGIEADTIGSGVYGYWFLGYSQEFSVPQNGTVTISGNFMKNNTFGQIPSHVIHPQYGAAIPSSGAQAPPALDTSEEGRNHIFVFILDRNPDIILAQKEIVFPYDNDTTWYQRSASFSLPPGKVFRVGIGAENNWESDYRVYVAWNGVTIKAPQAWSPVQ